MRNYIQSMQRKLFSTVLILLLLLLAGCDGRKHHVQLLGEEDVAGKTIGCGDGSVYDMMLSKRSDIQVQRYTVTPDMVVALTSGKIDAFLDDEIALSPAERRRHGVKIAFRSKENFDIAFAFPKGDQASVDAYNSFLAEIRQNGLYEEIRHRWFDTEEPDTVKMPILETPADAPPLHVAVSIMVAPMSFPVGDHWHGFEIELLQRYAHHTHRALDVKYYNVAGASAALQRGMVHVWSSSLFITEERKKAVLFTDPHYACHPAYFVANEEAKASVGLWEKLKETVHKNLILENRWRFIVDGLQETLVISLCSLFFGTLLAALICWMRMSRSRLLQGIAGVYIDLLRGVPLLVLLMIMFYVVLAQSGFSATTVAIISFSMVFAAYVSEMFRTAIKAVGHGQTEAGIALGFTPLQTFRYIVLPQATRAVMPVYKGEAVSLFKNTSIVGYIAIQDLTKASDLIRSRTFDAFFPLIFITIIYFVLAWLLGKALDFIVKKRKA